MTFMMQHCAISSDSTGRLLCVKYIVNSLVVYHRRTNFNLVLGVVHPAYFLQKMAHVGLSEIYVQGALGFCECVLRMARFSYLVRFGGIHAFQEIVFEVNMNFEIVSHIQVSFFYGSIFL